MGDPQKASLRLTCVRRTGKRGSRCVRRWGGKTRAYIRRRRRSSCDDAISAGQDPSQDRARARRYSPPRSARARLGRRCERRAVPEAELLCMGGAVSCSAPRTGCSLISAVLYPKPRHLGCLFPDAPTAETGLSVGRSIDRRLNPSVFRYVIPAAAPAAQISAVAAITGIAVRRRMMSRAQAAALVGGGILTILYRAVARRFLRTATACPLAS